MCMYMTDRQDSKEKEEEEYMTVKNVVKPTFC